MNILLSGKLDSIAMHLIAAAGGSNRIIVAARHIPSGVLPNNVRPFNLEPTDPLFEKVIKVGSFEAAVFFLARGEHTDKSEGGVTAFQSMLELCVKSGVKQIILVSSGEVFSGIIATTNIPETTQAVPKGAQGYQIKAAEDMCQQYWQRSQTHVTIVRLPYIYPLKDATAGDGLLANFFKAAVAGRGRFELPGTPETRCDFLSDEDAARLIWLIIDEGISLKSIFVNAGTGESTTFGKIAALLGQYYPDISIKYSGDDSDVPSLMRTSIAKTEYGWNVLHNLTKDFAGIMKTLPKAPVRKKFSAAGIVQAVVSFFRGTKGFIILEFAAATVLLQLFTTGLKSFAFADWIDLRLLFVVILSTLHGTISGIVSGIIAGVMLFISMGNTDWRMIVYNPENWIPFALYVIMGVALGSKADRQEDSLKTINARLTLAEQTNVYLVDLYNEAVRIKDDYRDQILGYKDNFGRIYTIVKKLNSEMAEYVFSSAIEVLEDVLENTTVAIYSISANGGYARMTVCSKAYYNEIAHSMRLHDYPQIMEQAEQHDIWVNRVPLHGFPSYCAPVYNEDKLIALVMIWKAGTEQWSLHYSNLFKILSGLIQESLVRAVKFYKLRENTLFYPETRILKKEPFWETYKVNLALAEQEKAVFGLIAVHRTGMDIAVQNSRIEACIRESDILGAANDDLLFVILKNVSDEDIKALLSRFQTREMEAEQVTLPEMHELMLKEAG